MVEFWQGAFVHVTGSTHKETGMRDVETQESHDKLIRRIYDEEIYELEFPQADVLVAMSQEAYQKFTPQLKEGGVLIVDSDLVRTQISNLRYTLH